MTAPYRTIPLHDDSTAAATYVNAVLFNGQANDQGRDKKLAFSLDLSRSHNFGNFQAHYGLGGTVGRYKVATYDSIGNSSSVNYQSINRKAGNYFFGGAGVDGGINFVLPSARSEWRVLGVETSLRQEFGKYADFRKNLPDSVATLVIRDRSFGTAGIYTELLGYVDESVIGVKMAYGTVLGSDYQNHDDIPYYTSTRGLRFRYFNLAFHYTNDRFTGYLQLGVSAKAEHVFAGVNYRLGKR